jgi:hypothetical protein
VESRIRIRIKMKRWKPLEGHFVPLEGPNLEKVSGRIRIRSKVNGKVQIRIRVKGRIWIRIRIRLRSRIRICINLMPIPNLSSFFLRYRRRREYCILFIVAQKFEVEKNKD